MSNNAIAPSASKYNYSVPYAYGALYAYGMPIHVWDRENAHTRTGYPICIWDGPYAYGTKYAYRMEQLVALRSAIQCIRGSRSCAGRFEREKPLAAVNLVQAETGLAPLHD